MDLGIAVYGMCSPEVGGELRYEVDGRPIRKLSIQRPNEKSDHGGNRGPKE